MRFAIRHANKFIGRQFFDGKRSVRIGSGENCELYIPDLPTVHSVIVRDDSGRVLLVRVFWLVLPMIGGRGVEEQDAELTLFAPLTIGEWQIVLESVTDCKNPTPPANSFGYDALFSKSVESGTNTSSPLPRFRVQNPTGSWIVVPSLSPSDAIAFAGPALGLRGPVWCGEGWYVQEEK